jgi:hypothetical protein
MHADQPTLFDGDGIPHARNADPETSHAAAAQITSFHSHCAALLRAYATSACGMTAEEAGARAHLDAWAASKRNSDLRRMGLIETVVINGQPLTRSNSSNRRAQVAAITAAGISKLSEIS